MSSPGNGLTARPLAETTGFNWVFLVELLTTVVLTIFFLFYFNRLFSTIVFYAIRAFTWRTYKAYIDVQSLQISLLGGRIFFKGLRYHAHNETVFVHSGFITWRYWLRKVREAEVYIEERKEASTTRGSSEKEVQDADTEEKGGKLANNKKLPCRIEVKVSGVEAFLYNRSPAYDYILQNVARKTSFDEPFRSTTEIQENSNLPSPNTSSSDETEPIQLTDSLDETRDALSKSPTAVYRKPPLPVFLKIFPIYVECKKAAAVLGNENTRSILTVKVDGADGVFEAAHAAEPLDIYRQIFSFAVQHPIITMKPNVDYKEAQLATARRLKEDAALGIPNIDKITRTRRLLRRPRKVWHALQHLIPKASKSTNSLATDGTQDNHARKGTIIPNVPGQEQWQGLARYLDDDSGDEHNEWDPVEYARSSTLADISKVDFTFYWDVPGPVSAVADDLSYSMPIDDTDINGTTPPGYGMDLHVYEGQVNYGPWADRQRLDFQNLFFPPTYVDAMPAKRLSAGQYREFSVFKLYLCVEEDVTLRLPFRESSKDWQWKGQAEGMMKKTPAKGKERHKSHRKLFNRGKAEAAPNQRPFGWLDVKVLADTTINFSQDMIARKTGYRNGLIGDIKGVEMDSSVNHGLLWRSGNFGLDLDLSYPLGWNTLRDWRFDVIGNDVELFILRDHLFLLTDLIMDWSAGPPPDFYTFVPFVYKLNLDFRNFKLNLNTNDANIVNEPASFDDNNFVILGGGRLFGDVRIPLDQYRPVKNEIPFSVKGLDFFLDQVMPPKSTLATFPTHKRIATLDEVTLKGSHSAYQDTSIALTDTLVFDIHGTRFGLIMYGWLIHYFVRIKENYFGDDLHFRTLEEYQQMLTEGANLEDFLADRASNRGNDLDVILGIRVDEATIFLPGNIYTVTEGVALDVPFATVDLRINNYYMDLQLDISPLSISQGSITFDDKGSPHCQSGQTQIFIDGVKLMGNRFFGLPPAELAYVNTWDVGAGDITGELHEDFVCILARAAQAFAVSAPDAENTLAVAHPIVIHDVVFLMLTTGLIRLWIHVGQDALLINLKDASVEFNDLAGPTFSGRVNVTVPEITVACVDCSSMTRRHSTAGHSARLPTHAYMTTSVTLNVLQRQAQFQQRRVLQQAHIRTNDQRTHRVPFLTVEGVNTSKVKDPLLESKVEPAASITPGLPVPMFAEDPSEPGTPGAASARSTLSRGRSDASTAASSHFATLSKLRSKHSKASFADSITSSLSGGSKSEPPDATRRPYKIPTNGKERRTHPDVAVGAPKSSQTDFHQQRPAGLPTVAFSSPIARPMFPLNNVELELDALPTTPPCHDLAKSSQEGERGLFFDDRTTDIFDDAYDHTSLIIIANKGLRAFFTPAVVTFALNAVNMIQPKNMDDMIDAFHCGVLGNISDHDKQRQQAGVSLDLSVKLPASAIRAVNVFDGASDQLDLGLAPVALTLKTVTQPFDRPQTDSLSLHILLEHLELSLRESSGRGANDVAIQVHMNDVLLWLIQKNSLSVNLSFRGLQLGSSTRKVEYMAGLAERSLLLAEQQASAFAHFNAERARRLQFMAYHLTMAGDNVPDPPFLTRLSYAMRASESHMRNHDSWKIVSRFRYIFQCLSPDSRHVLGENLTNANIKLPSDAEKQVIDRWDGWRAWDLSHVRQSSAMQAVYGTPEGAPGVKVAELLPLELALRSGKVGVILDPGPKQTDFTMSDLALALSVVPPATLKGLMLEVDSAKKAIIAQLNAKSMRLHVNWQVTELLESMLEMVLRNDKYHQAVLNIQKATQPQMKRTAIPGSNYQVVLAIDSAILAFTALNLRNENTAKDMKLSLLGSEEGNNKPDQKVSALLHARTATTDVFSKDRHLIRLQAKQPSVLIAQKTSTASGSREEEVKVVGGTAAVLIQIREEVLGLIETADAVIRDEAAYIKQLVEKVQPLTPVKDNKKKQDGPPLPPRPARTLPRLSIALEMGQYRIDIALLQSLSYSFAGRTGRLLVIPDLRKKLALTIALDLEKHHHYLTSVETFKSEDIAVLDLPSINGQVLLTQDEETSVIKMESSLIVEVIHIDASALHGLMETFKRPELSQTFDTLKADIKHVQKTFDQTFPVQHLDIPKPVNPAGAPMFEYRINAMLAGITVTAAASTLTNRAQAKLTFGLGHTSAIVSNRGRDKSELLPLPEVHAQVRRVFADLKVITQAETRHCGDVFVSASIDCTVRIDERGVAHYDYAAKSEGLRVNLFAETASAVVDVVNHLQDRLKDLDLSQEKRYLQRLHRARRQASIAGALTRSQSSETVITADEGPDALFTSAASVELANIEVRWIVGNSVPALPGYFDEDLVFSIRKIELNTRSEDTARLSIVDLQLAMLTADAKPFEGRPWNSALLPEVVFSVAHRSTARDRSLWLHAAGKPLEVLLEPRFVLPASMMERSISLAAEKVRNATATWQATPTATGTPRKNPFGNKQLGSLIVEADFAGATIHLQDRNVLKARGGSTMLASTGRQQDRGRYGQFVDEHNASTATVKSPGLSVRVQYRDEPDQSLNVEVQLDASSNILYPTIVPLIIEMSDTIKEVVRHSEGRSPPTSAAPAPSKPPQKFLEESDLFTADPASVLGGIQLNVGFRIRQQEFSLSCQPVARVAATTRFEDIYLTVNSVRSGEHGHFFALSLAIDNLQASVQHVYSRESTFSFDAESIVLSLINSKHLSGTAGISAILKVSPMRTQINARQLQDFLLFREIWFPQEIRQPQPVTATPPPASTAAPEEYLVARYQQIAEAAAFSWTATILFQEMSVELDLGQAIGKSSFRIKQLWASSKKSSNYEQNLCIGAESIGIDGTGRMSGLVELDQIQVRTSINWPEQEGGLKQTPRIQASAGFERLRLKAAFDYQAFAIADITAFNFMMYNVRWNEGLRNDRLVAILNGGRVQAYITATAAAQIVALMQAFERLIQDNKMAYEQSLRDVEKFLRRKSSMIPTVLQGHAKTALPKVKEEESGELKAPISLHTDVVVTLQALSVGCFPSSFTDSQVLLFEALDAQLRFAVALERGRIHSGLGMTLGQLKVALASISHSAGGGAPKAVGEISIDDVVHTVVKGAKGGTILRVPKVVATMQTWQSPEDNRIDYVFKSSFEGKVDVGWNFSRVSYIRGMWSTHSRSLASRLGKPLPESAVKITTGSEKPAAASTSSSSKPEDASKADAKAKEQEKITAVVNVPQSKYEYNALEPPIIETPQLRDMGEATPPLEWIGLHRDRLPNVTHQVIIIALLEVAKEVEDAYGRILGRS